MKTNFKEFYIVENFQVDSICVVLLKSKTLKKINKEPSHFPSLLNAYKSSQCKRQWKNLDNFRVWLSFRNSWVNGKKKFCEPCLRLILKKVMLRLFDGNSYWVHLNRASNPFYLNLDIYTCTVTKFCRSITGLLSTVSLVILCWLSRSPRYSTTNLV